MPSTHGPIDPAYKEQMKRIAKRLDAYFNGTKTGHKRTVGFALLVFPFGQTGDELKDRINYLSNAERKDMITAMKELVARFEGRHVDEQPSGGSRGTN